mmetsp:Transcript_118451/g.206155  ORF Transcript_118451/g.206155 Transcript_118451/m.206155 type:complete len:103 (-) Transcript_118451:780-1088(-)
MELIVSGRVYFAVKSDNLSLPLRRSVSELRASLDFSVLQREGGEVWEKIVIFFLFAPSLGGYLEVIGQEGSRGFYFILFSVFEDFCGDIILLGGFLSSIVDL